MTAYSDTPLLTKLGIDGDTRLIVTGAPPGWVASVLRPPSSVSVGDMRMRLADVILLFCGNRSGLESGLGGAMSRIPTNGVIWVAWPKRTSGVLTDLTENVIREVVLPKGLVDVKVAALDETWSGLKLVVRRELRGSAPR